MEYWGRAWADYCAAHWLHVHRRKQFTILQLVQLSSVKSSLSFTPYNVYSSQSTLLVGGTLQTGNAHVVALSAL